MTTTIVEASSFLVIDELGIDPLRDKSYEAITNVQQFSWHTVKPEEQHNAPLLSYNVYQNPDYWRIILIYNAILDMFALKEGMRIKIPAHQLVVSALNNILAERQTRPRTVSI